MVLAAGGFPFDKLRAGCQLTNRVRNRDCGIDFDGKGAHYEHYSGARGVIEYALMQARVAGNPVPEVRYNHVELPNVWKADVEIHHRPAFLCSPVRNCRLQRWLRDNEQFGMHDAKIGDCESVGEHCRISESVIATEGSPNGMRSTTIPTPTVSFNAVYQLAHIYRHLFDEGVGLRQLLDYYFVLRALHIEQGSLVDRTQSMVSTSSPQVQQWAEGSCQREENLRAGSQVIPSAAEARQSQGMGMSVRSNAEILHTLSSFGMKRFTSAVMYVLQTVFAMPNEYFICQPNEKEGKFLLNEIMQAGNFGKYDDRIKHGGTLFSHAIEKTKHNIRLLTHYPEEVLWEPFFRVYHWVWRKLELWRF